MNDEKYVVIKDWMVEKLDLKGNKLIIYAIIHGFSQAEGNYYTGGLKYLRKWTKATKQTVITALKELVEEGLVEKEEHFIDGIRYVKYRSKNLTEVVKKLDLGGQKIRPGWSKNLNGVVKNLDQGGQKIRPNNIYNNIYNNNINNKDNNIKDNSSNNKSKKQRISWV